MGTGGVWENLGGLKFREHTILQTASGLNRRKRSQQRVRDSDGIGFPCGAPPRMRLVGCLISSSTSFLSVFSVTSCSHQQAVLWHSGNQTAGRRGAPFVISAASLPARRRP